jgi:NADH dehydrogenase
MPASSNSQLHRIVIVGGGAAGLELATSLGDTLARKGLAEVTLIEKARTHVWKPKLHEIAAGSRLIAEHGLPSLCRALYNANEFIMLR